ncbi:hypothetical protein ANTRET_LOCUS7257 [Anthophora retusa]
MNRYSNNWYESSIPLQKLLLIIMIRSMDSHNYNYFGFYSASIEGFSMLLKTSVSCFMMMISITNRSPIEQ